MIRPIWIPVLVLTVLALGGLAFQRAHLLQLRDREAALLDQRSGEAIPFTLTNTTKKENTEPVALQESDEARPMPTSSDLLKWIPSSGNPTDLMRELPHILRKLESCSVEELLLLAREISAASTKAPKKEAVEMLASMLFMLVSDTAPERVLESGMADSLTDGARSETLTVAFRKLAERDLSRATACFESISPDEKNLRFRFQQELLLIAARKSMKKAADFLRATSPETREVLGAYAIGSAAKQSAIRADGWRVLEGETDPDVRRTLARGLLIGAYEDSGLEAVTTSLTEQPNLTPRERRAALEPIVKRAIPVAAGEILTLIRDAVPLEEQSPLIDTAIGQWTKTDVDEAGRWLGQEEPSPTRDLALQSFALRIFRVDPEAARAWAARISDPEIREQVESRWDSDAP
ncbi:MAG: hypothetical protein AAF514_01005 [Verrucomicrobiota bacterium]